MKTPLPICPQMLFHRAFFLLLCSGLISCSTHADHSALLNNVRTSELHLVCQHANVPDLVIQVPTGFYGEAVPEQQQHDMFYIFNPSDKDSVQRGMAIVQVREHPIPFIDDSDLLSRNPGRIADEDAEWLESVVSNEGRRVYQREIRKEGLFDREKPGADLFVQGFVVGWDSTLVEQLMASVETIRIDRK